MANRARALSLERWGLDLGTLHQIFLAMSHEPCAMSHEPIAINNRLIN